MKGTVLRVKYFGHHSTVNSSRIWPENIKVVYFLVCRKYLEEPYRT